MKNQQTRKCERRGVIQRNCKQNLILQKREAAQAPGRTSARKSASVFTLVTKRESGSTIC